MLKQLKAQLGAKRRGGEAGPSGPLTGKLIGVGEHTLRVGALLGEGGFANIYRVAQDASPEVSYALKHFRLSGDPEAAQDVQLEVAVMQALRGCPHVVALHEASMTGPPGAEVEAFVLMDLCSGSLAGELQACGGGLDNTSLLQAFLEVCHAVQAMHTLQPPLAHRDLKAENVLRHPAGRWVLCDFGSASSAHGVFDTPRQIALEEEIVRRYTTPAYRAPELWDLYSREFVGLPVDIWALGVLLYLLCFGRLPFEGEAKLQILDGRYTMPEGRPTALRRLISEMLVVAPLQRPDISQVVSRLEQLALGSPEQLTSLQQWPDGRGSVTPPTRVAVLPNGGAAASSSAVQQGQPEAGWAAFDSPPKRPPQLQPQPTSGAAAGSFWNTFSDDVEQQVESGNGQPGSVQACTMPRHAPSVMQPDLLEVPLSAGATALAGQSNWATGDVQAPPSIAAARSAPDVQLLQQRIQQLEEHCRVLEQLLDTRNAELAVLRAENGRQAGKVEQLRQAPGQAATGSHAAIAMDRPGAGFVAAQTQLQSPGTGWVSFNSNGGQQGGQAPAHMLLQPCSTVEANPGVAAVKQSPSFEALFDGQLALGGGSGSGRNSRGSGGTLSSFPVELTPGSSGRVTPSLLAQSSMRQGMGSSRSSLPGSRAATPSGSPPKPHRRTPSVPGLYQFRDLDPLT